MFFDPDIPDLHLLERALLEHPRSSDDNGPDALSLLDDPSVSAPASFKPPEAPPEPFKGYAQTVEDISERELLHRRRAAAEAFKAMRQGQ
jgi:hypothetical protein